MSAAQPRSQQFRPPRPEHEAAWLRQHFIEPDRYTYLTPALRTLEGQRLRAAIRHLEVMPR